MTRKGEKEMRFVSNHTIHKLNSLMLLLSFVYLVVHILEPAVEAIYPFGVLAIITALVIVANKRKKVMYAGLAYSFFAMLLSQLAMQRYELEFNSFYLAVLLFVYLLTILFKWQTTFITGFLVGYWLLLAYKGYELYQSGMSHVFYYTFSLDINDDILMTTGVLLITGLLFMLISKGIEYDYTGNLVENIDYFLFLMSFGYFLAWGRTGYSKEMLTIMVLYMIISYASFKGKYQNNVAWSSVSYTGISLVLFYVISEVYGLQDYYITVLGPLIIYVIAFFFKFSTYYPSGILFAYWAWLLYAIRDLPLPSWTEALHYLFELNIFQYDWSVSWIQSLNFLEVDIAILLLVVMILSGIGYAYFLRYLSKMVEKDF
jgi:hypothetical protein